MMYCCVHRKWVFSSPPSVGVIYGHARHVLPLCNSYSLQQLDSHYWLLVTYADTALVQHFIWIACPDACFSTWGLKAGVCFCVSRKQVWGLTTTSSQSACGLRVSMASVGEVKPCKNLKLFSAQIMRNGCANGIN